MSALFIEPWKLFPTLVIVAYVSGLMHELGHAVAGTLAGYRVTSFGMGTGGPWLVFSLRGCRIYCGVFRGGLTFALSPHLFPSRIRSACFLLGGLLANGLLALAAWVMYVSCPWGQWLWVVIIFINLALLTNILPFRARFGPIRLVTDGGLLLALWRGNPPTPEPIAVENAMALTAFLQRIGDRRSAHVMALHGAASAAQYGDTATATELLSNHPAPMNGDLPLWVEPYRLLVESSIAGQNGDLTGAQTLFASARAGFEAIGDEGGTITAQIAMLRSSPAPGGSQGLSDELRSLNTKSIVCDRPALRVAFDSAMLPSRVTTCTASDLKEIHRQLEHRLKQRAPTTMDIAAWMAVARRAENDGNLPRARHGYQQAANVLVWLQALWHNPALAERFRVLHAAITDELKDSLQKSLPDEQAHELIAALEGRAALAARTEAVHAGRDRRRGRIVAVIFALILATIAGILTFLFFDPFSLRATRGNVATDAPDFGLQLFGLAFSLAGFTIISGVVLATLRLLAIVYPPLKRNFGAWIMWWSIVTLLAGSTLFALMQLTKS